MAGSKVELTAQRVRNRQGVVKKEEKFRKEKNI